jgi:hypothetical protein
MLNQLQYSGLPASVGIASNLKLEIDMNPQSRERITLPSMQL